MIPSRNAGCRHDRNAKSIFEYLIVTIGDVATEGWFIADLPFTFLKVHDACRSFEPMPRAIDPADASDGVSLRILGVCLTDRVEGRATGVDLMDVIESARVRDHHN